MARRLVTLATAVLLLSALAAVPAHAGGGGHDAGRCPGFTEGEQVLLRDGCIEGVGHFLAAGRDLEVVNEGDMAHDYTAIDGSFGTGLLQPGERASIEAPDPGVYRVYCSLHASRQGQGMAGVLVVGDHGPEDVDAAAAGPAAVSGPTGEARGRAGGWVSATAPQRVKVALAASATLLGALLLGLVLGRRRAAAARH